MPRGRPRRVMSWDGVTEIHPWRRFPEVDNEAKCLILGSFPPNKFTTYRQRLTRCDEDFFYGSKDNSFWELFIQAKNLDFIWPDNIDDLKAWLINNEWIVSDIVFSTTRRKDSASDTGLIVNIWNREMISNMFANNPIKNIYFTSKWVSENFHKHIKPDITNYPDDANEFILMSPSPAGLISTKWCRDIFPINHGEDLEEYRKRYYAWVFA
jgi:G:T/U-mismatch repair DNA glycosylase